MRPRSTPASMGSNTMPSSSANPVVSSSVAPAEAGHPFAVDQFAQIEIALRMPRPSSLESVRSVAVGQIPIVSSPSQKIPNGSGRSYPPPLALTGYGRSFTRQVCSIGGDDVESVPGDRRPAHRRTRMPHAHWSLSPTRPGRRRRCCCRRYRPAGSGTPASPASRRCRLWLASSKTTPSRKPGDGWCRRRRSSRANRA